MSVAYAGPVKHGFAFDEGIVAKMPWTALGTDAIGTTSVTGAGVPVLSCPADGEIYGEGAKATSFYKVVSGSVRTCKFLSDGRRQIDAFYFPGDVFGVEAGAGHRLSAEAITDCQLLCYRRRGLETRAAMDDRLATQLFSYTMQCLERAQDHTLLLCRRGAAEKLAFFLLEIADRQDARELIELPMTRQDIADYLGLTIETVSRTLSQFERDGLIALPAARRIRLKDLDALEQLFA